MGRSCDYLAEAIATVNEAAEVKCVLDGPDLTPYWLHDDIAEQRCLENGFVSITLSFSVAFPTIIDFRKQSLKTQQNSCGVEMMMRAVLEL